MDHGATADLDDGPCRRFRSGDLEAVLRQHLAVSDALGVGQRLASRCEIGLVLAHARTVQRGVYRAALPDGSTPSSLHLLGVHFVAVSTHSLRDLRNGLGTVVREVAYTGHEAVITDNGREIAVIISMEDYERLHEHADVADALRLRDLRAAGYRTMSLSEMLDALGVPAEEFGRAG